MEQNSVMSVLLMMLIAWQSSGTSLPGHDDPIAVGPKTYDRKVFKRKPANIVKNEKIVGGFEIDRYSWPFMVLVGVERYGRRHPTCGGSIIDESHILSAAHCFRIRHYTYYITAAEHNYSVDEGPEQTVRVSKIVSHPDFDAQEDSNDIAILELSQPLNMTYEVSAVRLNDDNACPEVGRECDVAGWGRIGFEGERSKVPLEVNVTTQSDQICLNAYNKHGDDRLCAGDTGKDACRGDSGGPLMSFCGRSKGYRLVGVASYGFICGYKGYPGVYARVSYFINWINETIQTM